MDVIRNERTRSGPQDSTVYLSDHQLNRLAGLVAWKLAKRSNETFWHYVTVTAISVAVTVALGIQFVVR